MLNELKNFLFKGNILELAIAVIVAGAFGGIVSSFTADIIMPPLGLLVGGIDFGDLKLKPLGHRVAAELRIPAGTGEGAHVDQEADAVLLQGLEELRHGTGPVSDGPDLHALHVTPSPLTSPRTGREASARPALLARRISWSSATATGRSGGDYAAGPSIQPRVDVT